MNLTHHDDGKQRLQSHEVSLIDRDFYNAKYGLFSHDFMNVSGYGATKEEAVEDFKKKFKYLLDEMNAFGKLLLETDVIENEMIEVDCLGHPIPSGPILPKNAKDGDAFILEL